jgi:hypothetical protein
MKISQILLIVYYVMRSKNEVLSAAAAAKAHKTIFAPNNIYYFIFKPRA